MGGVQKLRKKLNELIEIFDFNDCHISRGLDDFKSLTNISPAIFGYTMISEAVLRF